MSATVNVSEIFKIEHVTIAYGWRKFVAVESLNLHLEKGGSLALLGLNGAGKTSTIRLLMGMVRPQIGQVEIFGTRPGDLKALARIGFAPEEATPPEYLKGEEYLDFVASFRLKGREARKKAVSDLMQWFEMPAQRRIRDYSKGMRRKLILAQAVYIAVFLLPVRFSGEKGIISFFPGNGMVGRISTVCLLREGNPLV